MRNGFVVVVSIVALLVVGLIGYTAGSALLSDEGSTPTTVSVETLSDCSQTYTTPSGEIVGQWNSGCASIEIGLDGKCLVDFPVDDAVRRGLAKSVRTESRRDKKQPMCASTSGACSRGSSSSPIGGWWDAAVQMKATSMWALRITEGDAAASREGLV